ncbi:RNA-binding protein 26-like isoform X1 [Argonauta hians]
MLIENVEALKSWLTRTLSPICDADPAALAKYVVALVKKDKPQNELNDNLIDQLDVFLQHRTRSFVDGLFEALKTKSYITNSSNGLSLTSVSAAPSSSSSSSQMTSNSHSSNNTTNTSSSSSSNMANQMSNHSTSSGQSSTKLERKRKGADGSDVCPSEEDKEHRKKRSRSSSPRGGRPGDDRRRRHDDRRFSNRRRSRDRSKSPQMKSRDRLRPSRDLNRDRDRSRSPVTRSFGVRSRSRSWSPLSRSRSRSRGCKEADSRGSTPLQDATTNAPYNVGPPTVQVPTSGSVSSVSSAISVVSHWDANRNTHGAAPPPPSDGPPTAGSATAPPLNVGSNRPRCRDYDEKGYCMRGDLCPYDHGLDPVIVEDVNLPNVLSFPHGHGPPSTHGAPGFIGPRIPPLGPPHMPQIGPRGPPPRNTRPVESYQPEGYNPEAPAINPPRPSFWVGPRGAPRPNQPFYLQPPRQRDLVNFPTIPVISKPQNLDNNKSCNVPAPETNRTVIPPKRDFMSSNNAHKHQNPAQMHHFQQNKNIPPNPPGGVYSGRPVPRYLNTTLEVRKIPRDLNNIAKLNEHFKKFGNLKNIQVSFENDLEAALITFANHSQANAAYRSSEPVFNNRFIKVFWHREKATEQKAADSTAPVSSTAASTIPDHRMSVKARLGIPAPNLLSLDNTGPKKTEPGEKDSILKKVQKQKRDLLLSYVQQQHLLKKRLADKTISADTKGKILKEIEDLRNVIKKFEEDLFPKKKATAEVAKAKPAVTTSGPSSSQKTKKEILDTELELMSKQNSGEDTTDLHKKLIELTQEAASLGLLSRGRGRGAVRGAVRTRGTPWSRGHRSLKMTTTHRSLDNRPKQIHVSGFDTEPLKNILAHFSLFCELVKSEPDPTETNVVLTFKSRQDAEKALLKCRRYKNKDLKIKWYTPTAPPVTNSADTSSSAELDDSFGQSPLDCTEFNELEVGALLAADDEDEEDEESRSWRR